MVSTLIQFGYEPVEATRHFSLIVRRYFYYYPGFIGYTRHIINERGWRALYRGVGAAILEEVIVEVASDFIRPIAITAANTLPLSEIPGSNEETPDNVDNINTTRATLVRATRGFFILSLSKCFVEIVTRPFHVIATRAIAQHVGEETLYSGVFRAFRQIYNDEGIRGLYVGLTPALLYHVLNSFLYEILVVTIEETAKLIPMAILRAGFVIIKVPIASYITKSYTYPFRLVSNVMTVNNTKLVAASLGPMYTSWKDCWRSLKTSGNLFRGNVMLLPRFIHNHPMNQL